VWGALGEWSGLDWREREWGPAVPAIPRIYRGDFEAVGAYYRARREEYTAREWGVAVVAEAPVYRGHAAADQALDVFGRPGHRVPANTCNPGNPYMGM